MRVAKRLITIALCDFYVLVPSWLSWAAGFRGYPIPEEVNVILVILVLPLNVALNPFLYTVNTLLQQQQEREKKLLLYLQCYL